MQKVVMTGLLLAVVGAIAPAANAAPAAPDAAPASMEVFGPQRDWPRFRGPMGNGVCLEKGLPTKWDAKTGENILWSVDIWQPKPLCPVAPYASPIVYKDKVFVTLGHYKDSIFSDPPKSLALKDPKPAHFADIAEFKVVCFNKANGGKLWETAIEPVAEWKAPSLPGAHAGEFSWATSTPCTDGERVYVAFGPTMADGGLLAAVDYAGKVVWRQDLGKVVKGSFSFTLCTSPTIYKDMVVMDGITWGGGATVAFDGKTGELKYRVPRDKIRDGNDHGAGAPTPVPVLLKGVPFLLNNGFSSTIEAINPEDGKVVSSAGAKSYGYASLAVGEGIVATHTETYVEFCTNNKKMPHSGIAFNVDAFAETKGDVTKTAKWKFDGVFNDYVGGNVHCSPIIAGGCLYLYGAGSRKDNHKGYCLRCYDIPTGKELYNEDLDVSNGATPFATADGLIYYASSGKSAVIKAGPKFEVVAASNIGDNGSVYWKGGKYDFSSPAVSDGKIFILGSRKLWCIGKK